MSFYKELLHEINSVRTNPNGYTDKIVKFKEYFEGKVLKIPGEKVGIMTKEGPAAFDQAIDFLKTMQSYEPFIPSKGLFNASKEYLENIQKVGYDQLDKIDINEIINKHGKYNSQLTNSMDFGSSTPEQIVINLLVCDGDSGRENREFFFNPILKKIGFASGKIDVYKHGTMIFAADDFTNKDDSDIIDTFEGLELNRNESVPLPTLGDMINPGKFEEDQKKKEEEERIRKEKEEEERIRKEKEEEERIRKEKEEERLREEEEKKKREEEERKRKEAEEAEKRRLAEEEQRRKEEEKKRLEQEEIKRKEEEMKKKEIEEREKQKNEKDAEEERKRLEYKEKMQQELKINRKKIEEDEKNNLSKNQKEQELLNTIILIYIMLLFLFNL